jgi:hypothetical protein
VNNIIKNAIQNRRILQLSLHGISYVVEPHAFGEDHVGNLVLLSYVKTAVGSCKETGGWKTFRLEKMLCIEETSEIFVGARPGYNRNDRELVGVIAQI